ncbi:MAG: type II toxin-antitoxin system RelE/ParE family toxin [Pseudomonadota bacterium]
MIKTFASKDTAVLFAGKRIARLGTDVQRSAMRKLAVLNRVVDVEELRIPPGNRLEKLSGDREGQWSMRVNAQWRVCFIWRDGDAWEVELVDYH